MKKKITTFDLRELPVGTVCHLRNGATWELAVPNAPADAENPYTSEAGGKWYTPDGSYSPARPLHPWDIVAVEVDDDTPAQAMSYNDQTNAFADDLDKLVERYRQEFEITYAQVVGCLQLKIHTLCAEAASRRDEVK